MSGQSGEGWIVKSTKTGKTLRHIKAESERGNLEYAGVKWRSISAFAWADEAVTVIPLFSEKAAKDMAKLYTVQTGDGDIEVAKVVF